MKIIIQKFGGTSVSTEDRRSKVIEKVKMSINEGYSPVLVVSAMGRRGEPYATDTLLSLVDNDFKRNNLQAIDMLMCCGELISSVIMSNSLINEGIEAIPLTGGQAGIITNEKFSEAEPIYTNVKYILKLIELGKVPVVTGFQGVTEDGYFTTLGRGGSDTSACILGEALKAEKGAYIVQKNGENPKVILIASGSEVATLIDAAKLLLERKGIASQVVSAISEGLFRQQPTAYQEEVIPASTPHFGLTAGLSVTLEGLVGCNGKIHGVNHFGYSAPAKVLDEKFGFTGEFVYNEICEMLGK